MKYKQFVPLLLLMVLFTFCKKDDSGDHFPEAFQKVWQDEFGAHGDEHGIYFTDTEIILWDYTGDDFDNGDDCYYEVVAGKLDSYNENTFRVFMNVSLFTGREDVEETLYIFNNNNWLSIYEESDVKADKIWFEDSRSRKDIEPLCEEE